METNYKEQIFLWKKNQVSKYINTNFQCKARKR